MGRSSINARTVTVAVIFIISFGLFLFQTALKETQAVFVDQSKNGDKSVVECYILDEEGEPQEDELLTVTTGQDMETVKEGTKLYVYHLSKIKEDGDNKTVKAIHITVESDDNDK